jgi:predicted transcriptional regulator of viral defense system
MKKTRIEIAKADIVEFFDNLDSRILTPSMIGQILTENRRFWRLTESMRLYSFVEFMLEKTKLKKVHLKFPSRTETRYLWGDISIYEVVLSLKQDSYFTHYTAMYLHEITEQIPKTIYLNFEQSQNPFKERILSQDRIDAAFRRAPRISKNSASYQDLRICILNGMYTGKLGVIRIEGPVGKEIPVTGIERTLIDIVVRPFYSGGVFEVLNAYRLAKGKFSVNKLASILKKLNYIYPYHQAVGFYLDRAGYKESQIRLLGRFPINYDFYLTYQMKDLDYSKKWRLYIPKGL